MSTPGDEARAVAAQIAVETGAEGLAAAVLSGQLSARTIAPLLAGMLDGALTQLFVPIVNAAAFERFDPSTDTPTAVVHLADGSRVRVIIDPMDGPKWSPGRWWRVLDSSGEVWCETSDEDEARERLREKEGDVLERLYDRASEAEWRAVQ